MKIKGEYIAMMFGAFIIGEILSGMGFGHPAARHIYVGFTLMAVLAAIIIGIGFGRLWHAADQEKERHTQGR